MRRPRHREKSNTLYKMLAVAALAGLALAPILIGVGTVARGRSLVPVQLVTVPSPPVGVKRVPPVVSPPRPVKPPPQRVAMLPASPVKSPPASVPVAKPPVRRPVKATPEPPESRPVEPRHKPVAKPTPRPLVVKKPSPRPVVTHEARALADTLRARKARADALEKRAHEIAVTLAARRAAEKNSAPTPVRTAAKPPAKSTRVAVRPRPTPAKPVPAPPRRVATGTGDGAAIPPDEATPPTTFTPTEPNAEPGTDDVPAEALFQPEPTVPDQLLVAPLHAVCRCRFFIHPDGTATVRLLESTGRAILDRRALQAARQWRFRPARRGGRPVESTLTIEMTFNVRPVP